MFVYISLEDFLASVIMGGLVGWLAWLAFPGRGFGFLRNITVGVIGGVGGGLFFRLVSLEFTGSGGTLVAASIGAVLSLAFVIILARRR